MTDEVQGGPAGLESSAPLSQPEVERARRLALTRLDELEGAFHRVSERLVSVEARLGELAEDLRVRVTALQQQTRQAVTSTLKDYEPSREVRNDVTRAVQELKDALRADVQEVAASMRGAFAESEQRVIDHNSDLLERISASAQEQASRAEAVRAAVEALRERLAAAPGGDELRAAIEALQLEVAASAPSEALRQAIEEVREHAASPADVGSLRAALESLREEVARSAAPGEELVRALEEVRRQAASAADLGSLREAVEALREEVARSAAPPEDLREPIEALRREVERALERLATMVGQGMEAAPAGLDQRLGDFRDHVERSAQALNLQTIAQVEQVQEAIEGWMMRFRDLLEVTLQSSPPRTEKDGVDLDELRADVAVVSRSLQDRLSQLDSTLQELRDRVDRLAEAGSSAEVSAEPPPPPPPPPPDAAVPDAVELIVEEPVEAPVAVEPPPAVEPSPDAAGEETPAEAPTDQGIAVEPPQPSEEPEPREAAGAEESEASEAAGAEEPEAPEEAGAAEQPSASEEAVSQPPAPSEPASEDVGAPEEGERERAAEEVDEQGTAAPAAPAAPTPRRSRRLPDLWSWGPRKEQPPQG